ncbi:UNVERIFIED_CONTAM: hypothetical protein PYX00_001321 [Menopon gallinae]|uniref:Tyrosine 3-monooxygenase n=1 Tax=Menopon gallinae TaxID=328185 RepID=A0AAW2IDM0_9NEOP
MSVATAQKNREMFAIKKSYSVENGYPSRRRSLVDDARFEAHVVKQNRQAVLEETRQKTNDECTDNCETDLTNTEATQIDENGQKAGKEFSSEDVSAAQNGEEDSAFSDSVEDESEQFESIKDAELTEEEMFILNASGDSKVDDKTIHRSTLVLRLKDGIGSLARILKTIENFKGTVVHVESRPSKQDGIQYDMLIKVDLTRQALLLLIRALRQSSALGGVSLLTDNNISVKDPWFPRHARDLDNCNHLMTKYEPELDMNHPGFADKVYRERRKIIADIAFNYKYGDPIPRIDYTESEVSTWSAVFKTVKDLMPKHACIEYRKVFAMMEEEGIFEENKIPQLEDVSAFLKKHTGFTLRPAAGLLTARDFLASLAFRVFQSTQYVRHTSSPYHTPEPDCIHELLGHMPLLADPGFAQFSQEIGLASLGASDEEIEKLSTVYWFTVEFGICKEGGGLKAYGAGLLSSYGELLHALSDKPEHRAFDPAATAVQPYQDQEYQPIYYVAESFEDAKEKFRRWVSQMSRPFEVRYNPHTEQIEILDNVDKLEGLMSQLQLEMLHLNNAFNKLRTNRD